MSAKRLILELAARAAICAVLVSCLYGCIAEQGERAADEPEIGITIGDWTLTAESDDDETEWQINYSIL